jgi:hypothetical protein
MTLQNRCDPEGSPAAIAARGLFTGNRGVIHDPDKKTLLKRKWTTKSWIICVCDWKGRRRDPMGRNGRQGKAGWTELFFLDEATAIAAGHRPCFACRRRAAQAFALAFAKGNGMTNAPAHVMDQILHRERTVSGNKTSPFIEQRDLANLPPGVMFRSGDSFFTQRNRTLLRWSFHGYAETSGVGELAGDALQLVTPQSAIAALAAGYEPVWHPSAGEA